MIVSKVDIKVNKDSKKSLKFCNSKKQFRLAYWKILSVAAAEEWDVYSSLTIFLWILISFKMIENHLFEIYCLLKTADFVKLSTL